MKNTKSERKKKTTGKGFWLWAVGAVTAGVLTGICILFLYTPKAYRLVGAKETEQVSLYLTNELGPKFNNQVQLGEPFELIISQSGLNEIINQDFMIQYFENIPLSDPYIAFSNQSILLMGTLTYERVSSVISITAFPTMDTNGNINMNIQSIRLGMMPATTLVTKLAQKIFDYNRNSFEQDPKAEEQVQAIIRNEPFEPIFLFSTDYYKYWVRISNFSIEQGSLKLTLSPEAI